MAQAVEMRHCRLVSTLADLFFMCSTGNPVLKQVAGR
jgi:hypothetical protein